MWEAWVPGYLPNPSVHVLKEVPVRACQQAASSKQQAMALSDFSAQGRGTR